MDVWQNSAEGVALDMERRAAGVFARGGGPWPQYWTDGRTVAARCELIESQGWQWTIDGQEVMRADAVAAIARRMEARLG